MDPRVDEQGELVLQAGNLGVLHTWDALLVTDPNEDRAALAVGEGADGLQDAERIIRKLCLELHALAFAIRNERLESRAGFDELHAVVGVPAPRSCQEADVDPARAAELVTLDDGFSISQLRSCTTLERPSTMGASDTWGMNARDTGRSGDLES